MERERRSNLTLQNLNQNKQSYFIYQLPTDIHEIRLTRPIQHRDQSERIQIHENSQDKAVRLFGGREQFNMQHRDIEISKNK